MDRTSKRFSAQASPRPAGMAAWRGLAVLLLGAAAWSAQPGAARAQPPLSASPAQQFQMALEAQSVRDYPAMLSLLRQAGEAGYLPAQEMLGLVLLAGGTVYGDAVPADRCEAGQWLRRAAAQGSEDARRQWRFLQRLRQAPAGEDVCGLRG